MSYLAAGVTVEIGRASLLADVSIEVHPGELVALAGPNGAGKTTLLSVLAGDRRPTRGAVSLAGRGLGSSSRGELARHRAVMSADRNVAFAYSAEEVALMGRLPLHGGDPTEADRDIVAELLAATDCAHVADRAFATLSTGERQRVSLARAIAQVTGVPGPGGPAVDERYLLLDEPTSSLDPAHQHMAMRLLRREARAGRGVLAIVHDLNLVAAYADRAVLLSGGRVTAAGSPAEILHPDALRSVFGIRMLVVQHPHQPYPIVIADPSPLGSEP
jgi:iron complex transport system ATP-binding protein